MSHAADNTDRSPWPHRWAVLLCGLTFPLLWVGQLITTTDAGMAVPDWPNTYGYNMFLYPAETWLFGPWDLFIEHGHRLLASVVGLVTVALVVVVWRNDRRSWLRGLSVAALGLVIFQGVLGGVRVLANERLVGMLHGSTGPAFFALNCALVVFTTGHKAASSGQPIGLARLSTLTLFLAFMQLVLGASLRHIDASVGPWAFAALVKFHLAMAAVVLAHTLLVAGFGVTMGPRLRGLGVLLAGAVTIQLALGLATWLAKYGAPRWAGAWLPASIEPIVAGGWSQTHTVTAHSAVGSLLLGLLAATATLAWRRVYLSGSPVAGSPVESVQSS